MLYFHAVRGADAGAKNNHPRGAVDNSNSYPQPLQPSSTAVAMYLSEPDYDDIISLDYRKKSAVRTALENLIQEESYAYGKDAALEGSCGPKRKPLRAYLGPPALVWEPTV